MKIIFILISLFISLNLKASDERWINFDWDPIEKAASYEVELLQSIDANILSLGIFRTDIPEWSKAVAPGKYFVKIRALDKRNVAGEWSEKLAINIKGAPPELEYPKYEQTFEVEQIDAYTQNFSWKAVQGANFYKIQIFNKDQKLIASEISASTLFAYRFSNPGQYYWTVASLISKEDEIEENLKKSPFKIIYGQLPAPNLKVNSSNESLIFSWLKVKNAKEYILVINKEEADGNFKKISDLSTTDKQLVLPKSKFQKGVYRAVIKAISPGYVESNETEIVYEYDLQEIKVIVEKSGEDIFTEKRTNGNFSIEGYFSAPSLNYKFKNYEQDTEGKQALTGSSLDITYKKNDPIHFLKFSDFFFKSNLRMMSLSDTYSSALFSTLAISLETKYNYKFLNFFPSAGLFIEKTPLFIISRLNTNSAKMTDSISYGLKFDLKTEYSYNANLTLFTTHGLLFHLSQLKGLDENTFNSGLETETNLGCRYIFKSYLDLVFKYSINNLLINTNPKLGGSSYARSGDINELSISGSTLSAGIVWYF